MGYRSNWKISIVAPKATRERYFEVLDQFFEPDSEERKIYEFILGEKVWEDDDYIEFADDWSRCSSPWENVVLEMQEVAENKNVALAYIRVGDEVGDVEEWHNGESQYFYGTVTTIDDIQVEEENSLKEMEAERMEELEKGKHVEQFPQIEVV